MYGTGGYAQRIGYVKESDSAAYRHRLGKGNLFAKPGLRETADRSGK
jgi:hypothetical protein